MEPSSSRNCCWHRGRIPQALTWFPLCEVGVVTAPVRGRGQLCGAAHKPPVVTVCRGCSPPSYCAGSARRPVLKRLVPHPLIPRSSGATWGKADHGLRQEAGHTEGGPLGSEGPWPLPCKALCVSFLPSWSLLFRRPLLIGMFPSPVPSSSLVCWELAPLQYNPPFQRWMDHISPTENSNLETKTTKDLCQERQTLLDSAVAAVAFPPKRWSKRTLGKYVCYRNGLAASEPASLLKGNIFL